MPETEKVNVPTEKSGLDRFLDAEDADAERILGTPTTQTDAPLEAAPEQQPSEAAEPPAEASEEPPATPKVEAAPAPAPAPAPEPVAEGEEKEGNPWKRLREQERELKAMRQQLLELSEKKPDPVVAQPAPEVEEIDPFTKTEQQIAALQQQVAQGQRDERIRNEEATFRAQKPDYDAATKFLLENEAKEKEALAKHVLAPRMLADPNVRPAVRREAIKAGVTEVEMAERFATAGILEARRQELIEAAWASGRSVPELAYEIATNRGYRGQATAPAPAAAPAPNPQERIAREKAKSEIAESLSGMTGTGNPPRNAPRTRAEVLAMPPRELDEYIAKMDAINPRWLEELP